MRTSKYDIFLKIVECGNFTVASNKLNYSQSALSQLVQSIEKELGVVLLFRGKKGVSLTPEGYSLLPYFHDICNAENRLREALYSNTNYVAGTVRIGAITSVSCHFLPKILAPFQKSYPQVNYRLIHGNYKEIEEMVHNNVVDMGFVRAECPYQFDMHCFSPEPLHIILSPNHPLARLPQLSLSDLNEQEFILLDDGYTQELTTFFKEKNITPHISQIVKGNLALLGLVSNGLGISLVPEPLISMLPDSITWKPLEDAPTRTLAIACKDRNKLSLVNRLFFDTIVQSDAQFLIHP